jgi:DNA-directed RNA polymerase subunit M/transcription elongation factor TFIIS
MTYRDLGREALKTVLNQEQNVRVIEMNINKAIYQSSQTEEERTELYKLLLFEVMNAVLRKEKLSDILATLKKKQIFWNHPGFDDIRKQQEEQDEFITNPFEVVEGAVECKCGSKRVYSYARQVRSADEGTSVFAVCCECGNKWRHDG